MDKKTKERLENDPVFREWVVVTGSILEAALRKDWVETRRLAKLYNRMDMYKAHRRLAAQGWSFSESP